MSTPVHPPDPAAAWPEPPPRPNSAVFSPDERAALHAYDASARAFAASVTSQGCESALAREFLSRSDTLLPDHPYLMMWEWEVVPGESQHGCGDLVFTDGAGAFAVVELKWVVGGRGKNGRDASRKRRRKVEHQAREYGQIVCRLFRPSMPVLAYFYTDERLGVLPLEARYLWTGAEVEEMEVAHEERYPMVVPSTVAASGSSD